MHVPKFPLLLTLGDRDLELLLQQMVLHGNPQLSDDKKFVHECCAEIHKRRQKSVWTERMYRLS